VFEDREGNIWVGTQDGLDRFRDVAAPTISRHEGLSSSAAWSVQATPDGSVWITTADGLNRWENDHATVYGSRRALGQSYRRDERSSVGATEIANSGLTGEPQSLGQDQWGRLWASTTDGVFYFESGRFIRVHGVPGGNTFSVVGDRDGSVWISNGEAGLFRLTPELVVQCIPWSQFGHGWAFALLPDRLQGGLWLGFHDGGVAHLKDGQIVRSYSHADGLGNGVVSGLRFDSNGALWAATEGGLSRIKDGHITTLTSKNGLPCDGVHWFMEDDDHAVWLYKPCGLARIARSDLDAWVNDPERVVHFTILDAADGVRSFEIPSGYPPMVTKSAYGKIWFLSRDGVGVVDPHHLPFNKLPPPVHIEQITANREIYEKISNTSGRLRLPPLLHDLQIDYTALSLVAPEKVRFRYKLEGLDRDWQDAGSRRQAFYTNLPPRNYRFRVTACNNSGVWNEAGAFLDFSIAPAYYQTWWFRVSCVAALLALIWAVYQLRLRQVTAQVRHRLEGRFEERERIARELHDTLLQSFQGFLLYFQAAINLLPGRPSEAKERLERAADQAQQAIAEGRDAVQGLRSSTIETNDLAAALNAVAAELAKNQGGQNSPVFCVQVEGASRDLHAILRDDIFRIAGEALRNAFLHAQASRIEVQIHYDESQLRVRIRDDGKGIDPQIVTSKERPGHWGLRGMQERAKLVGGSLEVWSKLDSGTEIELTIPASTAYATSTQRRSWLSRKGTAVKS